MFVSMLTVNMLSGQGLDLPFQKWFVSFPNENNSETDLKCRLSWLRDEENFPL